MKFLVSTTLILFLLVQGQSVLIPLLLGIVLWYVIISIAQPFHRLPRYLALAASFIICSLFLWATVALIADNINTLIERLPAYQEKLSALIAKWGLTEWAEKPIWKNLLDPATLLRGAVQTSTNLVGKMGLVVLYALFLLIDQEAFSHKLRQLLGDQHTLLTDIHDQVQRYIRVKIVLSAISSLLAYLVMASVGLDFALFWAFLTFLLNFIPNIGALLATLLPSLLAIVQFHQWTPFLVIAGTLTTLQFVFGNIIEPRLLSRTVNLSGLVIILSLVLWGTLWGAVGLFLGVPIMAILNIVFSKFDQTKPISLLLSNNKRSI